MNNRFKTTVVAALCGVMSVSLSACATAPTESAFDNPRPWQDKAGAYEYLDYAVCVYDTTTGLNSDDRTLIATGTLTFELTESIAAENTTLDMSFSVTYGDAAPEADRGLTDTIESSVTFTTSSLVAQRMSKSVKLADRPNERNLSYEITADYHGTHTAVYTAITGEQKTLALPNDVCRDNEMMYMLARAQAMTPEGSTMFKIVNMFESFALGGVTEFTLYAQTAKELVSIDMDEFVKDLGVQAVTNEETGEITYPVSCYNVNIGMSGTKSGPPYNVYYTENPFVSGSKSHAKVPVRISYNEYKNNSAYRCTEYDLIACSFDNPKTNG